MRKTPPVRTAASYYVKFGQTEVEIRRTFGKGESGRRFLVIHDDEDTAADAVRDHIAKIGGTLIELDSRGAREVTFTTLAGATVRFDPNRMFSDAGLGEDLEELNKGKGYEKDRKIFVEIHKLRKAILGNVMNYRPVIAVHNNSENRFDITWYAVGGKEEEYGNTRDVPGNPGIHATEDPDDFFLVTMVEDFNRIKGKYNVVLQSRHNDSTRGTSPKEDGSLSVKCKRRRYFNVEAGDDHRDKQLEMLEDLERVIAGQTL